MYNFIMNKQWIKTFYNKLIEAESNNSEKEINACLKYKKEHLPRFIYKYRSCNKNAYNDLFNNRVHLSYPTAFNDPLDCSSVCTYEQGMLLQLLAEEKNRKSKKTKKNSTADFFTDMNKFYWPDDYIEYVKQELLKGKPYKPIMVKRIQEMGAFSKWEAQNYYKKYKQELDFQVLKLGNDYKNKMLLCSFAATVKNNLMWSHYAEAHTGFCIEYDLHELDKKSQFLHALYPIIYSKKPILSDIKACFYTDAIKDIVTVMNKSSDWSYEQEFRLFCPPEIGQDYYMPIIPSRIFLGLNIKAKDEDKILNFAYKNGIEVRKMEINASSFNLSHKRAYLF